MMVGFRAVRRSNQLHVDGVEHGDYDIIDHVETDSGYVLAVMRTKGRKSWYSLGQQAYYPTCYELVRLTPISSEPQSMNGRSMREFPKEDRKGFHGDYRIENIYLEIYPGRHRGMVRELRAKMRQFAAGRIINWKSIKFLDGKPLRTEDTRVV